jgi:GT2 family glycosyltransferase
MVAPIVLFVYNRPEHTRKTLEALQNNQLAAQSKLIVYSDGPRSNRDRKKVEAVRKVLQEASGFKSIDLNVSEENRGLARSIIDGVTHVINEHGRVIVLEDDLVVSQYFLNYMNDALDYYASIEKVMHISGYWYPLKPGVKSETFLIRYPSSWGWATWDRAWRWFEKDPHALHEAFSKTDISRFNLDGAVDIWEQVVHNLNGKANTWAVFWYATIFRKEGLCLYPTHTLVQNIGMDGSGQHCLVTKAYENKLSSMKVNDLTDVIEENKVALNCFKKFHTKYRVGRLTRFFKVYLSLTRNLFLRKN